MLSILSAAAATTQKPKDGDLQPPEEAGDLNLSATNLNALLQQLLRTGSGNAAASGLPELIVSAVPILIDYYARHRSSVPAL